MRQKGIYSELWKWSHKLASEIGILALEEPQQGQNDDSCPLTISIALICCFPSLSLLMFLYVCEILQAVALLNGIPAKVTKATVPKLFMK